MTILEIENSLNTLISNFNKEWSGNLNSDTFS